MNLLKFNKIKYNYNYSSNKNVIINNYINNNSSSSSSSNLKNNISFLNNSNNKNIINNNNNNTINNTSIIKKTNKSKLSSLSAPSSFTSFLFNNNNNNSCSSSSILNNNYKIFKQNYISSTSINLAKSSHNNNNIKSNNTINNNNNNNSSSNTPQQHQPRRSKRDKIKELFKNTIITPKIFLNVSIRFIKNYKKIFSAIVALIGILIYSYNTPDSYLGNIMNMVIRFSRAVKTSIMIMVNYKKLSQTPESSPEYTTKAAICHQESADLILDLCLTNGGLYIKAGQYIGSLNHILPPQFPKTLRVLQDQAPWRSYLEVEEVFIKDLGQSPEHYFSDFNKIPIAAASLAQVHHAITKEGDEVAVKVQYSDLQRNFEGDIFTHKILLYLINLGFPDFEFNWMADEMKTILIKELDFIQEADNAERTAQDLKDNPYAYIPKVYRDYSSKRILVTEFINGCKVNDIQKLKLMGLSEKSVCSKLIEIMSEQIFLFGFVHVDPHPGNIMVRPHPQYMGEPQIVLLDHGLYRELDEEFRLNFCHLYKNLVLCNNKKVQKYSLALGVQNYKLFSTMILMRNFEGASVGLGNSISNDELEKLLAGAMERIKDINTLMKSMPRHLLLILRNNNLLRSINMDLGSPINRFSIMARYATQGINSKNDSKGLGIARTFRRIEEKVHLEIMLKGYELYYYFVNRIFKILYMFGLINPQNLIKDQMKKLG